MGVPDRAGDTNVIEIYYCDTRSAAVTTAVLSPEERERLARFGFEDDRRDYAAAHTLLRVTLGHHLDTPPDQLRFATTDRGKPYLIHPPNVLLSCSLAHTRGLVACVISDDETPVGIDVERIDHTGRTSARIRHLFPPEESLTADGDRFYELWTMKEALAKALGVGIAETLALNLAHATEWSFGVWTIEEDYKLAVATGSPNTQARCAAKPREIWLRDAGAARRSNQRSGTLLPGVPNGIRRQFLRSRGSAPFPFVPLNQALAPRAKGTTNPL